MAKAIFFTCSIFTGYYYIYTLAKYTALIHLVTVGLFSKLDIIVCIWIWLVGLANGREIQKTISNEERARNCFINSRVEEERQCRQNDPKVFPQAHKVSFKTIWGYKRQINILWASLVINYHSHLPSVGESTLIPASIFTHRLWQTKQQHLLH